MSWTLVNKFVSIACPFIVVWCTWLSREAIVNEEFRNSGVRFTMQDGYRLEEKLTKEHSSDLAIIRVALVAMPDWPDWKARIERLETKQIVILENQARILVLLEEMRRDRAMLTN